jgi:heme ABC exporter ATP-binding subunit CcmA
MGIAVEAALELAGTDATVPRAEHEVAPALALDRIVKRWEPAGVPVLDGVTIMVAPGTVVVVSGRNGSGKTTLLRVAAGLITPEAGSVHIGGRNVELDRTAYQRRLGFLAAGNTGLYARLRVEHHLEFWARIAYVSRRERPGTITRALHTFGLRDLCGRRVDRLSMGQRQRLRMALAFLHQPSVVLLDEPRTSLDEEGVALLGAVLADLRARGGAAVICVPSGEDPGVDADRRCVVAGGQLTEEAS